MNKFICLVAFLISSVSLAAFQPKTVSDFYKTSVRVYNLKMNSGGTGSILRSYRNSSYILTNKHVCRLIEPGGYVERDGKTYNITHYKKFPQHDLCLVRIDQGLGVSLQIERTLIKRSSVVYVSGHPNLLPHIMTVGHVTDHLDIELVVGLKECTKQDLIEDPLVCAWFGGMPMVETFDSQVISNLIKPGSSGSAVFNRAGNLVGVVYAGSGRGFSHGFIVPHLYLLYFTQNLNRFSWVKIGKEEDHPGVKDRIFNYEKCKSPVLDTDDKYKDIRDFCKNIKDNVIGRM